MMSLYTFLTQTKPPALLLIAVRLLRNSFRGSSRETVSTWERETGLEPATACLEGRWLQDCRLLVTTRLRRLVEWCSQKESTTMLRTTNISATGSRHTPQRSSPSVASRCQWRQFSTAQ